MRLWHKSLISVLPKQQLLGQWRECCCIARNIAVNGTPNHILVNKIMDYPLEQFIKYAELVTEELYKRGYICNWSRFGKWLCGDTDVDINELFSGWYERRYLRQCYYNLQEKYDCGGITEEEWLKIYMSVGFI